MKSNPLSIEQLKDLLKAQPHYLDQEGELNTALLHKLAQQCERDLLELLFADTAARKAFFLQQGGVTVFVRDHFIDYIQHKRFVANSYTAYKNKIGLHDERDFLKKSQDVVLAFPFKDCVLEGGQTKSEAKRTERYYHRILAIEEIDRLLDPKVLSNARRYTKEGNQPITDFNRHPSDNTISDNLIIKGNNLIALHSIKEQFAQKVKLIYIDPPYNTSNDSFLYNDNFKHSTWLVFMKNRLEVARELLREDGVIFVQCDDNEQAYLKVLMDEVFGRENFISSIVWQRSYAPINLKKYFSDNHDTIHCYSKKLEALHNFEIKRDEAANARYKNPDNDPRGVWSSDNYSVGPAVARNIYPIITPSGKEVLPPKGRSWVFSKERTAELLADNRIYFPSGGREVIRYKRFLSEVKEGVVPMSLWLYQEVGHTQDAKREIKTLFNGEAAFESPKPERLLQRIIEIATKQGDLVLDFCLGSGTTAAVAHKMGRQYIGIEQMDYIQSIAVERLTKVIAGEQGGISKNVKWTGEGSFVYLELKAHNQAFIQRIQESSTKEQLLQIQQELLKNPDLDYRLNTEAISQSPKDFAALSLENQKQILIDFLELNQLYVPHTERKDTRFNCTHQEITLSESFYR